jgi:hypothetical protein
MHNAPAVSYPAGRSFLALAAITGIWLLGGAGVALWAAQVPGTPWRMAAVVAVVAGVGAISLVSWSRSSLGSLSWDGQHWTWAAAGSNRQDGTPEVALDAQRLLLLRWQSSGGGDGGCGIRWLWLERGAQPAAWDDLRRAVYSRARPRAPAGAQPSGQATP